MSNQHRDVGILTSASLSASIASRIQPKLEVFSNAKQSSKLCKRSSSRRHNSVEQQLMGSEDDAVKSLKRGVFKAISIPETECPISSDYVFSRARSGPLDITQRKLQRHIGET